MTGEADTRVYRRQVTSMERLLARSPFCIVTVVARVSGEISEEALRSAVTAVQRRHPNLRVRLIDDDHHNTWFKSDGAGAIPIEVVPRESDGQWIGIVQEAGREPFPFEELPPVRFILVRSPEASDLIILCHHILCDGFSLAFLARDILEHLGDPSRAVEVLPDPTPVTIDSIPDDLSLNPLVRLAIRRINRKWLADPVFFDQRDYEALTEGYWRVYDHQLLPVELSASQTGALVERCREERVTVNSALAAAFTGAQATVLGTGRYHPNLAVAADLRGRLRAPVGQVMGFYAGAVAHDHEPDPMVGFWENARRLHSSLQKLYTNKTLFKEPLTWCHLEPSILEAINFKKLGGLVQPATPEHRRLHDFAQREDVVLAILKRDKMESLDRIFMGTALTNLGHMDIPTRYGPLVLDRLFMKPGGAFPLVSLNLLVGAVTAADKLSLVLEYVEENIDKTTMMVVKDRALEYLFGEN